MQYWTASEQYVLDMSRRNKSENTLAAIDRTLVAYGNLDARRHFVPDSDHYVLQGPLNYGGMPVTEVNRRRLERFLYREPALSPATFNRYRSVMSGFLDWCVGRWYCDKNVAVEIPPMRAAADKQWLILSPQELLQLLEQANPVERIALALGMHTGLRASDIVSLTVGDVDLRAGYISTKIQKTGGVDRKPITQELDEELNRWLACYGANRHYYPVGGLPNTHLLVPSYTIDPQGGLHLRPLQKLTHPHRLVQRAIASLDLPTEGEGFHTLRRSSARAFFEQLRQSSNADHALMVVKSFLNHKNVSQTEHYLGISTERVLRDEALRGQSFLSPLAWVGGPPGCTCAHLGDKHRAHCDLTRHTEATEFLPGTITLRGVESA